MWRRKAWLLCHDTVVLFAGGMSGVAVAEAAEEVGLPSADELGLTPLLCIGTTIALHRAVALTRLAPPNLAQFTKPSGFLNGVIGKVRSRLTSPTYKLAAGLATTAGLVATTSTVAFVAQSFHNGSKQRVVMFRDAVDEMDRHGLYTTGRMVGLPLGEELVFRGLIFSRLLAYAGAPFAYAASTALSLLLCGAPGVDLADNLPEVVKHVTLNAAFHLTGSFAIPALAHVFTHSAGHALASLDSPEPIDWMQSFGAFLVSPVMQRIVSGLWMAPETIVGCKVQAPALDENDAPKALGVEKLVGDFTGHHEWIYSGRLMSMMAKAFVERTCVSVGTKAVLAVSKLGLPLGNRLAMMSGVDAGWFHRAAFDMYEKLDSDMRGYLTLDEFTMAVMRIGHFSARIGAGVQRLVDVHTMCASSKRRLRMHSPQFRGSMGALQDEIGFYEAQYIMALYTVYADRQDGRMHYEDFLTFIQHQFMRASLTTLDAMLDFADESIVLAQLEAQGISLDDLSEYVAREAEEEEEHIPAQ